MKKERRTLLVAVGAIVFFVIGALVIWLLGGNAESVDSQNQDGGGLPLDIGGRGLWG